MASHHFQTLPNVSGDLIWQITRASNSFLVKRKTGGGIQLSRDPLNLRNVNTRTHAGFANDKAVGIQAGEKGEIILTTKKTRHRNRPASNANVVSFHGGKSGPKVYRSIVNYTAKQGYRPDLREDAVARASRVRQTARSKKDAGEKKPRGSKAQKTA